MLGGGGWKTAKSEDSVRVVRLAICRHTPEPLGAS